MDSRSLERRMTDQKAQKIPLAGRTAEMHSGAVFRLPKFQVAWYKRRQPGAVFCSSCGCRSSVFPTCFFVCRGPTSSMRPPIPLALPWGAGSGFSLRSETETRGSLPDGDWRMWDCFCNSSCWSVCVIFGMALASTWAVGEYPFHAFVNLEQMARYHGVLNSVGFVLCSLVGWNLLQRKGMQEKCQ